MTVLEWFTLLWWFTAKIWLDTNCRKRRFSNFISLILIISCFESSIYGFRFMLSIEHLTASLSTLLSPVSSLYRGSKWCHIVPPARWQEKESRFLLPWVWRSQDGSSGPAPTNEWQGQSLGKFGHSGVGWSHWGPRPRGHGQGKHRTKSPQQCNLECICTHNLFRLVHLFGFALHFCMRNKQNMLLYPGQGAVCEKLGEHCYRGDTWKDL